MTIKIDGFEIDCAVRDEPVFESEVTTDPVEQGAAIADHIIPRPVTLSLECVVTDSPIGAMLVRRGFDPEILRPDDVSPSDDAFTRLSALHESPRLVVIETPRRVYTNMAMQSFTPGARNSEALFFVAVFVQVRLVTNERTTVRVSVPRGSRKVNRGVKSSVPEPIAAPPSEQAKEQARQMLGRVGSGAGQ